MILFILVVATEDWKHDCETGKEIFGYIVTSGPRFYRLCPLGLRKKWFTAFRQSKFACLTYTRTACFLKYIVKSIKIVDISY
jgi:hypothetical protein